MEFEEEFNPWNVSNVEEFLYFCCPECDFRTEISSGRISFMRHALSAHPRAKNLIESPDESRLNHLIHEESDKNDNMYTEIKQNEPFIPKIKKRNINDVSELSEVKVEENHLPPDDNFSIPDQNLEPSIVISSVRSMASETKNDAAKERITDNLCFASISHIQVISFLLPRQIFCLIQHKIENKLTC